MSLFTQRPNDTEYGEYFRRYTALVPEGNILSLLDETGKSLRALLRGLDETRLLHRYAPGKWSIKEVVMHLMDCERVFLFRALWFARGDATPLPGFDEDGWASASHADALSREELLLQHEMIRAHTLRFFATLPASAWEAQGIANGRPASVRSLAWILAGHELHHLRVVKDRYDVEDKA